MDFMVDLETLSSDPTAVVVQIGVVAFDIQTGRIEAERLINVDPHSEILEGFTVDGGTIMWWMDQAKGGKCTWNSGNVDSKEAWIRFCAFIKAYGNKNSRMWSHATFDAPIVTYHLNRLGLAQPVHYNRYLDLRTISVLTRGRFSIPKTVRPDDAHDALADCRYQIKWLVECWRRLKMGT